MSLTTRSLTSLAALVTAIVFGFDRPAAAGEVEISGTIRDQTTAEPVQGALVTLQATSTRTETAVDGSYALTIPDEPGSVIVAAKKGYYNRSVVYESDPAGLDVDLEVVPHGDNPDYVMLSPYTCAFCHPNQYERWNDSRMQRAGINTWVHDIYNGDGTPGGKGGFVYTRDSMFKDSNPNSECASCHQPESWIPAPFSRMEGPSDPGYPSIASMHGISCETCHKIAHVDESLIDYPGIFPGAVDFTRPDDAESQVEYGMLGDADFVNLPMRPSYQPQLEAAVCGACHQDRNDPDEDHSFTGPISEPTYREWAESPYGDPDSPSYASCLDCHMLPSGDTVTCEVLLPPLEREKGVLRSHAIEGSSAVYLDNAADLEVEVSALGHVLEATVHVTNSQTGHHLPTGVTVRNMILLVEAWRESDGIPLEHTGANVVHDLGGIGDPQDGYYAGLPGRFFAKINHDQNGNGPTFFTDAFGITSDNRIPALQTDTSTYAFAIPEGGGELHVKARLVYRRAFRFLVDAKQWTQTGHGEPLEDVIGPDFGHLMEMTEVMIAACGGADVDGDLNVGVTDLVEVILAWGACEGCPQDVNGDGAVDVSDLIEVIIAWGPCGAP